MRTFPAGKLATLIAALKSRGYNLIGPTLRDGVIDCAEIDSLDDIPVGWTDVQDTGHYRLQRRGDRSCFGYVVGPHSWKRYFYPPDLRLWSATRTTDSLRIEAAAPAPRKLALIGVRSCDLSAIRIQDQVLMQQDFQDAHYRAQRENVFIVAVNCVEPGNNCFCTSMNSGPRAADGYDVALTELIQEGSHIFLAEAGSGEGRELLAELNSRAATEQERETASRLLVAAADRMGRTLATKDLPEALSSNSEHPRWEEVSRRCLACANCTMVCPTCFCHTIEDVTDLTGQHAERIRRWDSCFTADFSYIHGGSVRPSIRSRYRQWLTHKLATWHDQFGTSGCVGCGRCITWCPVGIDLTVEATAIREIDHDRGKVKEDA